MRKFRLLMFVLAFAFILVISSCKAKKKDNSNNKELIVKETYSEGSVSTGDLKLDEYAMYYFTPSTDGFYNCVCSAQYFNNEGQEIDSNHKPYQLLVSSKAILPCLRSDSESNTYYLQKSKKYTVKINANTNSLDTYKNMIYKMMISSAKFDVESLITKTSSGSVYQQILVIENQVAGEYALTNITGVNNYYLFDISDISIDSLKKYEPYSKALNANAIWESGNEATFNLVAGKKYAFVLYWQLENKTNQVVNPSLIKVER